MKNGMRVAPSILVGGEVNGIHHTGRSPSLLRGGEVHSENVATIQISLPWGWKIWGGGCPDIAISQKGAPRFCHSSEGCPNFTVCLKGMPRFCKFYEVDNQLSPNTN